MTKYFIDKNGVYLGGFDGAIAPTGAVEVENPPENGRDIFTAGAWVKSMPSNAEIKEKAKADLLEIDLNSIRSMREYLAAKADAPKFLKDREAAAAIERAKLV